MDCTNMLHTQICTVLKLRDVSLREIEVANKRKDGKS